MPACNYQSCADVLASWRDDVTSGTPPVLFPIGSGDLEYVEVGPGLVTLIGGAPGAGKTAFAMQAVVDALRLTPTLRAVVCNIEMPPSVLLDRQLARLSGVNATAIRYRRLTDAHAKRIEAGLAALDGIADRLAFVRPPFTLENIAATADEFSAGLIVIDYIQRVPPPGDHADKRASVDATMDYLRKFADAGLAVIVLSAVGRTKDKKGRSSYTGDGLNLASFRESSELEFGADDAFILLADQRSDEVTLRHLKSRNGECRDIHLTFDRPLQHFATAGMQPIVFPSDRTINDALRRAWEEAR